MADQETPLFSKIYRFSIELYLTCKNMPKRDRYVYGERLEDNCETILENVIAASSTSKNNKLPYLKIANIKLEILKVQLRMANEINLIPVKKYLELEGNLQEAGKMLGGWIRYQTNL